MQRVICKQPGELVVEEVSKPDVGPGHILVKIERIGICGTDIHAYAGNQPFFQYPRVLGHELSGVVDAVGEGVELPLGQTVYIIPYMACGQCLACRRGRSNCCSDIKVLGVHTDGGMCEYLSVPAEYVVPAQGLDADQLAVVECLAIGAHAVRRANIIAGANVLVVGAGPIGMGILQFAKVQGAKVIVMDVNPERLAFCREKLGADETIVVGGESGARLEELTQGEFAEVIFDATGNPRAMEAGFQLLSHAGTYVLVSIVKADISFSDPEFHKRETTLLGSRNATREDFERVVSCLKDKTVDACSMVTHRGKLEQLPALLHQWSQPGSGVIKALIDVS